MKGIGQHGEAFPEKTHTKHKPTGDDNHFVKRSEHVPGNAHQDNPQRMSHPQRDGFQPNDESGEGQDGVGNSMGAGLGPEFN